MSPDLNTLPITRASPTPNSPLVSRPRRISFNNADNFRPSPPSPRSPSLSSLQAAATINAGLHRPPSSASPARIGVERRRSSLLTNLALNDPSIPAPGEMQASSGGNRSFTGHSDANGHHGRQPSLGELHQELESEQEAQVNRLLHMIRIQQDQLSTMSRQQQQGQQSEPSLASIEQLSIPNPSSNTAASLGTVHPDQPSTRSTSLHSPSTQSFGPLHRPHSLSRQSSARLSTTGTSSRGGSPSMRPLSGSLAPLTEDFLLGGTRDEPAFYQAETQMLTRENQMLKHRIRELERQIAESASSHPLHSPLATTPATFSGESAPAIQALETLFKE